MSRVRVIANAHYARGGGERSTAYIMRMLVEHGHQVEFHSTRGISNQFPIPEGVRIGSPLPRIQDTACDVLIFYANNAILQLAPLRRVWERIGRMAGRKILCLNWKVGQAAQPWFCRLFDRVGFLCTDLQSEFLRASSFPESRTFVRAPAVDLSPYLAVQPDYTRLTLVRHSHPNKYHPSSAAVLEQFLQVSPDARIELMGLPDQQAEALKDDARVKLYPVFTVPPPELLSRGSLYWYMLPAGFTDQGPRTIVEAMAAGLPCVADNRDGAKDRITCDTGWLCNSPSDYEHVFNEIVRDRTVLQKKGTAARNRAIAEFDPKKWLDQFLG